MSLNRLKKKGITIKYITQISTKFCSIKGFICINPKSWPSDRGWDLRVYYYHDLMFKSFH